MEETRTKRWLDGLTASIVAAILVAVGGGLLSPLRLWITTPGSLVGDLTSIVGSLAVVVGLLMILSHLYHRGRRAKSGIALSGLQGQIESGYSFPVPGGASVLLEITITNAADDSAALDYRAHVLIGNEKYVLQPVPIIEGFELQNPDRRPLKRWSVKDTLAEKTLRVIPHRERVAGPIRFTVRGRTVTELTDSRWIVEFKDSAGDSHQTPEFVLSNASGDLLYVPGSGAQFTPSNLASSAQGPRLTAEIRSVMSYSPKGDAGRFFVVDLEIVNLGVGVAVRNLRAALASGDGGNRISGTNVQLDKPFEVTGFQEGYKPESYRCLEAKWLDGALGEKLIDHLARLPGFFIVHFEREPFFEVFKEVPGECRLEVIIEDVTGLRCGPLLYPLADKDGTLAVGFGYKKEIW